MLINIFWIHLENVYHNLHSHKKFQIIKISHFEDRIFFIFGNKMCLTYTFLIIFSIAINFSITINFIIIISIVVIISIISFITTRIRLIEFSKSKMTMPVFYEQINLDSLICNPDGIKKFEYFYKNYFRIMFDP
jgi:hypothetical protein